MQYILEQSKIKASLFTTRGFLIEARDMSPTRGAAAAALKNHELYLSIDAIESVLRWVSLWEESLKDNTQDFPGAVLHINGLDFVLCDPSAYQCPDVETMATTSRTEFQAVLERVRENVDPGGIGMAWSQHGLSPYHHYTESCNKPGLLLTMHKKHCQPVYNLHRNGFDAVKPVYATSDLTLVRIVEALFAIADTNTYPQDGYKLALTHLFGNTELAALTRDQVRDIAERLVP